MRSILRSLALASIASQVSGVALEARGGSCGPFAVNLAYDVLTALHASQFCTSWLSITTVTQTSKITSTPVVSITTTTTTTPVVLETATTSTTDITTTSTTATIVASTSTDVINTLITETSTTSTSTSIATAYLSTTTTYSAYGYRKVKRDKPAKPSQLISMADNLVSSACSCYATTPTVSTTQTIFTTSTAVSIDIIATTSTSIVSTETDVAITTFVAVSDTTITPLTTIISTQTSLVDVLATTTSTTVIPSTSVHVSGVQVVQVDPFDGCTVIGSALATITGIIASSFIDALDQCLPHCEAFGIAGGNQCTAVTISQAQTGGTYSCYVQDQYQAYSNNFDCAGYPNPPPYCTQYLLV